MCYLHNVKLNAIFAVEHRFDATIRAIIEFGLLSSLVHLNLLFIFNSFYTFVYINSLVIFKVQFVYYSIEFAFLNKYCVHVHVI